jgi:hypothetical protein
MDKIIAGSMDGVLFLDIVMVQQRTIPNMSPNCDHYTMNQHGFPFSLWDEIGK